MRMKNTKKPYDADNDETKCLERNFLFPKTKMGILHIYVCNIEYM